MRATSLHGLTLALREEFPSAIDLRLRKSTRTGRVVWQVVGSHPKHGKVARQLDANKESDVFLAARSMIQELDLGFKGRVVPTGQVQRIERATITTTANKGHRDATIAAKVTAITTISSWLAEHDLGVEDHSLRRAISELAPENNRRRRAIVEGARALAKTANTPFSAEGLQFKEPLPRRREAVNDETLFRRLDHHLPKIRNDGAIWVFRMVAVLGIRGNGVLSLDIPDAFDDGSSDLTTGDRRHFRETSWKCPRISRTFPGNYREVSRTFPGKYLEISWTFSGSFLEIS